MPRDLLDDIRSQGAAWDKLRAELTAGPFVDVTKMLVTIDSFATPRALWHTDPVFRRRMLAEWDKIEPYKAKGFIAEWPV